MLPAIVDEVVDALVRELEPNKIILFGSAARGEVSDESDLDLMIVVPQMAQDRGEITRAYRALRSVKSRPPVDVLVFSQQDVEDWGGVIGHVINDALSEGRVAYDAA
jgi:uncharacterized protein